MTDTEINDKAVEAAAAAWAKQMGYIPFVDMLPDTKARWMVGMRAALQAALPHLAVDEREPEQVERDYYAVCAQLDTLKAQLAEAERLRDEFSQLLHSVRDELGESLFSSKPLFVAVAELKSERETLRTQLTAITAERDEARANREVVASASAKEIGRLRAQIKAKDEALEPLARLQIPAKPQGNAGAYSIRHDDIRRARTAREG